MVFPQADATLKVVFHIIKHTWTKTRGGGNKGGRWEWVAWWGGVKRKGRKLYLNNSTIQKYLIKKKVVLHTRKMVSVVSENE